MRTADVMDIARATPGLATIIMAHDHWKQLDLPPDNDGRPYMRLATGCPTIGTLALVLCSHLPPGVRIDLDKDLCVIEGEDRTRCDEHALWPFIQIALKLPKGKTFRAATCTHCGAPGQTLACEYCKVSR